MSKPLIRLTFCLYYYIYITVMQVGSSTKIKFTIWGGFDDSRINENGLFKQDWRSRSRVQVLQYIISKWLLAFLVGLLTGIIATLINLAIENIAGYKLLAVVGYIHKERLGRSFLIVSKCFSRIPTSIMSYFSYPRAIFT